MTDEIDLTTAMDSEPGTNGAGGGADRASTDTERQARRPTRREPGVPTSVGRSASAPSTPASRHPRPDARPLRVALGFGSVAALSALATAIVTPAPSTATLAPTVDADPGSSLPPHIVRYVQLKPGETAPPQAVVRQAASPQPRVVTVVTRQSGTK